MWGRVEKAFKIIAYRITFSEEVKILERKLEQAQEQAAEAVVDFEKEREAHRKTRQELTAGNE